MPALLAVSTTTTNLHTPLDWGLAILSIVLIDIVLAGDNAVVIALAVRRLEKKARLWGIIIGSGMAVALRVGLTFVAAQLLAISYIKLIGGVLIVWIAVKLLVNNTGGAEGKGEAQNLWQAVWLITVADITMSVDNVMAVAGASKGSFGLLLFGLGLSIPLVVFTSTPGQADGPLPGHHLRRRGDPRQSGRRHDHDRPAGDRGFPPRALAHPLGRGPAGPRGYSRRPGVAARPAASKPLTSGPRNHSKGAF